MLDSGRSRAPSNACLKSRRRRRLSSLHFLSSAAEEGALEPPSVAKSAVLGSAKPRAQGADAARSAPKAASASPRPRGHAGRSRRLRPREHRPAKSQRPSRKSRLARERRNSGIPGSGSRTNEFRGIESWASGATVTAVRIISSVTGRRADFFRLSVTSDSLCEVVEPGSTGSETNTFSVDYNLCTGEVLADDSPGSARRSPPSN